MRLADGHKTKLPYGPFALSRDDSKNAMAPTDSDTPVRVYELPDGNLIASMKTETTQRIHAAAFDAEGKLLAVPPGGAAYIYSFDGARLNAASVQAYDRSTQAATSRKHARESSSKGAAKLVFATSQGSQLSYEVSPDTNGSS